MLGGMVWSAPPVQVGTVNGTVLLPFGKVRFRSNSISVPQANDSDVWIWNGVAFVPLASIGHVRITRAALCDRHTRSGGCQRRRDSRRISAAVVLQRDIQINALVAVDDAVAVALMSRRQSSRHSPGGLKFRPWRNSGSSCHRW